MEITWKELLKLEGSNRIEMINKILSEEEDFIKYQKMLNVAREMRNSESIKHQFKVKDQVKILEILE